MLIGFTQVLFWVALEGIRFLLRKGQNWKKHQGYNKGISQFLTLSEPGMDPDETVPECLQYLWVPIRNLKIWLGAVPRPRQSFKTPYPTHMLTTTPSVCGH